MEVLISYILNLLFLSVAKVFMILLHGFHMLLARLSAKTENMSISEEIS